MPLRRPIWPAKRTSKASADGVLGGLELVEPDAVGNYVDLVGGDAFSKKRTARNAGGHGDCVRCGVDCLLALDDVRGRRNVGDAPAAILLGENLVLKALMG